MAGDRASRDKRRDPAFAAKSLFAGGVAGCAAKTLVAPMDRVKILFQTSNPDYKRFSGDLLGVFRAQSHILHNVGIRGLFQGHSMQLARVFPYGAINFMAYEQFRNLLAGQGGVVSSPMYHHWVAGAMSGIISTAIAYPLELIRVRMAFDTRNGNHGVMDMIRQMAKEQPVYGKAGGTVATLSNFYRGCWIALLGIVPYAGFSFYINALAKKVCHGSLAPWCEVDYTPNSKLTAQEATNVAGGAESPRKLKGWATWLCGGVAGVVAQTLSYPIEIVRRRMQVAGLLLAGKRVSSMDIARHIFRESGPRGFFVGLSIGYLKMVPMKATSFYVYDVTMNAMNANGL
ncbi:mitochondrial carrier [Ramicandelaber brevisporus]|nr:mitochondrial carrier [Ramicandelaber brevisporus]